MERDTKRFVCDMCGIVFTAPKGHVKYCEDCRKDAYKATMEKRKKELEQMYKPTDRLGEKMEQLKKKGLSYADAQKAETLRRAGHTKC